MRPAPHLIARLPAKLFAQMSWCIMAGSVLMAFFHLHDFHYVATGTGFIVISVLGGKILT